MNRSWPLQGPARTEKAPKVGPEQMARAAKPGPPVGPPRSPAPKGGATRKGPSLSGGNGRQPAPGTGAGGRRDPAKDRRPLTNVVVCERTTLGDHPNRGGLQAAGSPSASQGRRAERSDDKVQRSGQRPRRSFSFLGQAARWPLWPKGSK